MSALDDRRQNAREAFHDTFAGEYNTTSDALDEAIETATRVDITEDMITTTFRTVEYLTRVPLTAWAIRHLLVDAFRAAGFEVER
jgi:hypothetical protein